MSIRIDSNIPDMSKAATRRLMTAATDVGLVYHRKKTLPIHFKSEALTRYPREYANSGAKRKRDRHRRRSRAFNGLTASQKAERRQQMKRSKADGDNSLPLVSSGRLRSMVLTGHATLRGNPLVGARAMTIATPPYLDRNRTGSFNKRLALSVVRPDEEQAVAGEMEKFIHNDLNKPRASRRRN